jgi:hypothetical protein
MRAATVINRIIDAVYESRKRQAAKYLYDHGHRAAHHNR